MTKAKVINCKDTDDLTNQINSFIKDKIVIDIKFDNFWVPTQMCGPTIHSLDVYARALIIYREV